MNALFRPPYRQGFVDGCLAGAPPEAAAWMSQLEELVAAEIRPVAAGIDRDSRFPREELARLRELGAFSVAAPRDAGGLGFGDAAAALMIETVAAACPSTATILMFHNQVVRRIDRFGTIKQRRHDLERLGQGDWSGSSAWTELGAGADKSNLKTRLVRNCGHAAVNGQKHFCTGMEGADIIHVLVDAPGDDGEPAPTFVRVASRDPGVDTGEIYDLMGLRGSSTGTLRLCEVEIEEADIVGDVGAGMKLMQANHENFMNPGLLALGIARAAYEEAKLSVTGLASGARDITVYQNTRLVLAELELKLGAAYAYAAEVVKRMNAGANNLHVECTKVKVHASEMACELANAVMRLAGGRGLSSQWPFERHFRDAQATILMGPANELIKERIAAQVLAELPWSKDHGG